MYNKLFTSGDYNSNDGFMTTIWGPMFWQTLHIISFNYPTNPTKEDKINYYDYIQSLTHILPCKKCRDNLKKNLQQMKFSLSTMKNRDSFSRFIYELHNQVNVMLNKPIYKTYDEVRDTYERFRARCIDDIPSQPKHIGCFIPNNGISAKCVINIVPQSSKTASFSIDSVFLKHEKKSSVRKSSVRKSSMRKSSVRKSSAHKKL